MQLEEKLLTLRQESMILLTILKQNETIFTVANTPPGAATILFPTDLLNTTQQPLDLNVTFADDADSDTITIYYYINGKLNQTSTTTTTFNASDGNYELKLYGESFIAHLQQLIKSIHRNPSDSQRANQENDIIQFAGSKCR